MSNWEIFLWLAIILVFNPVFTYLLFVRRLKVTKKGRTVLYAITTAIAIFWFGISTRYFILTAIAAAFFVAMGIFRERFFSNVKQAE